MNKFVILTTILLLPAISLSESVPVPTAIPDVERGIVDSQMPLESPLVTEPIDPIKRDGCVGDPCACARQRAQRWCADGSDISLAVTLLSGMSRVFGTGDMKKTCNFMKSSAGISGTVNAVIGVQCERVIRACRQTCDERVATHIPHLGACNDLGQERNKLLVQMAANALNFKQLNDSCKQINAGASANTRKRNFTTEDCHRPEHFYKKECICLRDPNSVQCNDAGGDIPNPNLGGFDDNYRDNQFFEDENQFDSASSQQGSGSFTPPGGGGGALGGGGLSGSGSSSSNSSSKSDDPEYDTDIVGGVQSASGGGGSGGGSGGGGYKDASSTSARNPSSTKAGSLGSSSSFFDLKKFLPGGSKAKKRSIASVGKVTSSKKISTANGESNFQKITRTMNEKRGILLP